MCMNPSICVEFSILHNTVYFPCYDPAPHPLSHLSSNINREHLAAPLVLRTEVSVGSTANPVFNNEHQSRSAKSGRRWKIRTHVAHYKTKLVYVKIKTT